MQHAEDLEIIVFLRHRLLEGLHRGLAVSLTIFMGLATRNVPSAAPQMMTTSQGWISTSMWPPMAMKAAENAAERDHQSDEDTQGAALPLNQRTLDAIGTALCEA